MKKILLTNDDGLHSPGLTTLVYELLRSGRYDLRVVAPEKEQSGVGHCITIHWPLFAESVTLPDPVNQVPAFRVAGTPADCVKLAITNLFPDFAPDLVISGINRGPNVGMNVFYSGTVGGAMEASMNGLPAMAISLDTPKDGLWHYGLASEMCGPIIDAVFAHTLPQWCVLNVNIPNCAQKEIQGIKMTSQGKSGFKEFYVEEAAEAGRRRFRLEGAMVYRDSDPLVDAIALRDGFISVTALGLSVQDDSAGAVVKDWPIFKNLV